MFIQTETTPNPASLKFMPGLEVAGSKQINFANTEEAKESPLAEKLFAIKYVTNVYFGADFITITKNDEISWDILKPEILLIIMEHFTAGNPVFGEDKAKKEIDLSNYTEIEKQIIEIIETRVRPAVAQDGGDIIFKSFDDGIVKLELHGSCSGCPSSTITLKNGIENMLKYYVPEVIAVEAVA